jgi:hypothetical protein
MHRPARSNWVSPSHRVCRSGWNACADQKLARGDPGSSARSAARPSSVKVRPAPVPHDKATRTEALNHQSSAASISPNRRAVIAEWGRSTGGIMFDALNPALRYRDLAHEYYNIAVATSISAEGRNRYLRMAEHYNALADAEEELAPVCASGC